MSEPTREKMASPRTLREWCRVTCAAYPNVDIKDMSTSFRDGLAFCAIIHKHRPDLIDFRSLSKDNVYQNNKLAFQVAETKLGIPALLDPKEMVSTKVPDCLSIITYLSQYYDVLNRKSRAGPAGLRSSHATVLNSLTKCTTPDGLKPLKSSTHLETDRLSATRPRAVCSLCLKPVHLIQRHLIDGKVYHRSCFRCKVCHSTLLPESYTQGSDAGSLVCTFHVTDLKTTRVDLKQQIESPESPPKCNFQTGCSIPRPTKQTVSQDQPVCETAESDVIEGKDIENRHSTVGLKSMLKKPAPPYPPRPSHEDGPVERAGKAAPLPVLADDKTQQEAAKIQQPTELASPCDRVAAGSGRLVPAPRQMLNSSVVPVPAPRTKPPQAANSSPAAGDSSHQSKCPPSSSRITSPTRGSPNIKAKHPWMTIIHPGPWTQLPPAPAPVPTPRSKSVSRLRAARYRPKVPPPNPFEEHVDEAVKSKSTDQTKSPVEAGRSENVCSLANRPGDSEVAVGSGDAETTAIEFDERNAKPLDRPDYKEADGTTTPGPAEGGSAVPNTVWTISQICLPLLDENRGPSVSLPDVAEAAAGQHVAPDEGQSHLLPRSLSVPVISSVHSRGPSVPEGITGINESVASWQSKPACRENPFDRTPTMTKSKTFQVLPSRRAPAPGHGFPLIKRKVQTDQNLSTDGLQTEMGELEKRLEVLQQRGVKLESNLRDCKNDKDKEQMLMEWFSLLHERQVLVRRDTELVYLTKQQKLEERQADVEYELRCLLNKPEKDWSQEDRGQEQQLMDELVAIIEQRNQIISSLDQDRQREREEDGLSKASMKKKEFQKDGLKELKKSKGKFKPTNVLKMLNHKAESTKDFMEKKS